MIISSSASWQSWWLRWAGQLQGWSYLARIGPRDMHSLARNCKKHHNGGDADDEDDDNDGQGLWFTHQQLKRSWSLCIQHRVSLVLPHFVETLNFSSQKMSVSKGIRKCIQQDFLCQAQVYFCPHCRDSGCHRHCREKKKWDRDSFSLSVLRVTIFWLSKW